MIPAGPLLVTGSPGSPYTRKLLAALRYRRVAYRLLLVDPERPELPQARIPLLPTVYFEDDTGTLQPMADTTPILQRLDREHSARPAAPVDPVLAFVDSLIEDFADEWLTKVMFHYRWSHAADLAKSARVLPNWFQATLDDAALETSGSAFARRQVDRLAYVGSNASTAATIERSYERLGAWLEAHLAHETYLLGSRPATADFACYGQLSQLALFDPTPRAIAEERFPRVVAWTMVLEDCSGVDAEEWASRGSLATRLGGLLSEIGRTYAPLLLANARALAEARDTVELVIDGAAWRQTPFSYQAKCLAALRSRYADLSGDDMRDVDDILAGTGCETLFGAAAS